ncbi:50S ribosomal protein L19 [Candidatus Gottesmanbacteria bacterium]|nr:50S ribosomal protein L19 [Candidatus Gottesmanbacteria bacterium]
MANAAIHGKTTFHVGDTVSVHYRLIEKEKVAGKAKREVKEEERERIQVFEGIVIAIRGEGQNAMFTVRRIGSQNIGIERIFPLISPWIKKISVKKLGKVKRAKLYYLRGMVGRQADKLKEKTNTSHGGSA